MYIIYGMPSPKQQLTLQAVDQLRQIGALINKRRAQLARCVGLTEAQWRVLEGISNENFMPSLFAKDYKSTPGAISKLLRQILDKGLAKVSISTTDARQRDYELTRAGTRLMSRLRCLREEAIDGVWSDFTVGDLRAFTAFNERLIDNLGYYLDREEQEDGKEFVREGF